MNQIIKSALIKVHGRVQGVGFRYYTKQKATELNIQGYVQNKPDRTVVIEAQGEEEDMKTFIDWCHIGPQRAMVSKVDIQFVPPLEQNGFMIK